MRNSELTCSFCHKPQSEVEKLIAGPSVYICDECIRLSSEIVDGHSLDRWKRRCASLLNQIADLPLTTLIEKLPPTATISDLVDVLAEEQRVALSAELTLQLDPVLEKIKTARSETGSVPPDLEAQAQYLQDQLNKLDPK